LELMGTDEQQEKWISLVKQGRINGAYCQTELAHGTFVRGIETTATFDSTADAFVINTPTITSTKYWPGSLGFSCTHALVMARLIIARDDYGPHLFMVEVRAVKDGTPLPGIELGDVGMKPSYNSTDNGWARFTNVVIPRANMLMGQARVDPD